MTGCKEKLDSGLLKNRRYFFVFQASESKREKRATPAVARGARLKNTPKEITPVPQGFHNKLACI